MWFKMLGRLRQAIGARRVVTVRCIAGNIQFNGDILVHLEGLGGGVREGKVSDVPATDAVTVGTRFL